MIGVPSTGGRHRGRAGDPGIDARVLEVAHRHLSALGYQAMSVAAVAQEAGTTRQALYRRWRDKASLAADALKAAADAGPEAATADPFADLVAELADFQRGVSRPGRDRKSTRLNSSHVKISYAVFCLKKKKKKNINIPTQKKKKKKNREK